VNENVVWVAGQAGTFVRTTDGGATWSAGRVPGAERLQFRDVHAVDDRTAYLLSIGNGTDSRIYKTTDAGATWTLQFTNPDSAAFYDCFDFWDARRGIVISDAMNTETVTRTTTDGGATWQRIPSSSLPAAIRGEGSFASSGTCVITRPGGHAWISTTKSRVLHSADFGRTWSVSTVPITVTDSTGIPSVSFRDARNGMAFGGFGARAGDTLIAVTADGGATWTVRTRPPIGGGLWGGAYVPGARTPTVVAVGTKGAAYSRDEARTWVAIDTLNYWGLGFASPRAGWIVGARGRITKLSGF
jgi:photosystem II stability/assembly factor-like uncharacterized protein